MVRSISLYAALSGVGLMVFGLATYLLAIFLPAFVGSLEVLVVVSAFAAPMVGFILTMPWMFLESANWRMLIVVLYIMLYYAVILFVG